MSRKVSHGTAKDHTGRSGGGLGRVSGALLLAVSLLFPCAARATVLNVTSTNDSGSGSLRQAILDANALIGADEIRFNLGANKTITLANKLPTLTTPIDVNGTSQPGWSGTPLIVIDGQNVAEDGFLITSRACKIRGLVINGFGGNGIAISGADDVTVQGNRIGLNAAGTAAVPNGGSGIAAYGTSVSNKIGGKTVSQRNVISGNGVDGITLSDASGDSVIVGNFIGTNAAGSAAVRNSSYGIRIFSSDNQIGGVGAGAANLISGNGSSGVVLLGTGNTVVGNVIGLNSLESFEVPNGYDGVDVFAGPNVVGSTDPAGANAISGNDYNGIYVGPPATGVTIMGNRIGPNRAGDAVFGNSFDGVVLEGDGNTVGGATAAHGNVISGNGDSGVAIDGDGNAVLSNVIGLDATGTVFVGNDEGITITGAMNTIGAPGQGNTVSANGDQGIVITGVGATGNVVQANRIGTKLDGTTSAPNLFCGIRLSMTFDNLIGGEGVGEGNVVSRNGYYGVCVESGDGNAILGNSMEKNGRSAIEIAPVGVALNDPGDVDSGPNHNQNHPVLTTVGTTPGSATFNGVLWSSPSSSYTIELFSSPACHASGFGQGKTLVGRFEVQTDEAGFVPFQKTFNVTLADPSVTATATNDVTLDTSEFSPCVAVDVVSSGVLQFPPGPLVASEADPAGMVPISVVRTGNAYGVVTVDYASTSSGATPGVDYEEVSGTLTFLDGEVVKTFDVPVHADTNDSEGQESVALLLSNPTGGATLGGQTATLLTLTDASLTNPVAWISDGRVVEGPNGSTRKMQFTISVSAHTVPVAVAWGTVPGTATEGVDYDRVNDNVGFLVGELEKTIEVPVRGDGVVEGDETFFVEFVGLSVSVGDDLGVGTILDADAVGASALCTNGGVIAKPKLIVNYLGDGAGNEVVKLRGKIKFPGGQPAGFSPLGAASRGAQILIEDLGADGAPIWELSHRTAPVPGGLLDDVCSTGLLDGWTVSSSVKKYEYANASGKLANACASGSARGLKLYRLLDRRDTFTQAIEFFARTRTTTVAEPVGPLRLTVVLGSAQAVGTNGACATFTFDAADCKRNATGTKLVCR